MEKGYNIMSEIFEDDWGDNNIIKVSNKELKRALIRKHLGKLCTCKNRTILIDKENRRVECSECGAPLDPFDVLYDMCFKEHMYYSSLKAMRDEKEELEKWLMNNRMGKTLRELASHLRQGMIPCCPECDKPFDIENIKSYCSKNYAIALKQEQLLRQLRNNSTPPADYFQNP